MVAAPHNGVRRSRPSRATGEEPIIIRPATTAESAPTSPAPRSAPTSTTRRGRARTTRRRRTGIALAVVLLLATALPAAARAADQRSLPRPGAGAAQPDDALQDEDAWCSYLESHYLSFPSPWSARVINCGRDALAVAPVYSDEAPGTCVVVPARHSRHLGGNIARWVTDIRLC
ncbi:hypothetical protein [Cellulomonas wangsupingiae]|uniref:hypothetical protein n=1 Tax=Cellulomonas wangsupingiae TaxID=2968085 RepID=UPI001D0EAD48|nr:hypothetical protein [Cellulomonas wangsupingiae]MCM0641106.1 hypothetical protein [Cellulomonas wangsupingiae]